MMTKNVGKDDVVTALACLSSLSALTTSRGDSAWEREVRSTAHRHLHTHFARRGVRVLASGSAPSRRFACDDQVGALEVLVDPKSSLTAKAGAKTKLAAYFEGMLRRDEKGAAALSSARRSVAALTARVAKMETASAVRRTAPRVTPTALRRRPTGMPRDSVIEALARAERVVLRSLGRSIPLRFATGADTGPVDHIARAERNTLRSLHRK